MFRSSKLAALLVAAASIALLAFPVMASATATPDVQGNVLTVTSDGADQITLSVVEVGGVREIALNGVATGLAAGAAATIVVNAGGEDDVVDASALVAADYATLTVNGDTGADILTGGGGIDTINGGDDVDELRGGDGNDRLTGGKGNELIVSGDLGDDTMIWNAGDGSDRNDGGEGIDTVLSNGAAVAETYTYERVTEGDPAVDRVLFQRTAGAPAFSINFTAERLEVNLLAGDDTIAPIGANLADLSLIANAGEGLDQVTGAQGADTLNGDAGNDVLNGGDAIDELRGGNDNDTLTGGKGNELIVSGDLGDDTMIWNAGDGSDRNDGGAGIDTVLSNGAPVAETYTYEGIAEGDPAVDRVLFQRTAGAPAFSINFTAEKLEVNLLAGDDTITSLGGNLAGLSLIANGDTGADTIVGAIGNDTLNGGDDVDELRGSAGNDRLTGGKGDETRIFGEGNDDTMVWNAGDGSDRNDGGEGIDTVLSNGAAVAETYTYEGIAEGDPAVDRVLFQRTAGAPAFSINFTAERLEVNLLAGEDTIAPVAGTNLAGLSLIANAGEGLDQVTGAQGADTLNGDADSDILVGGPGTDTANGGDGDDLMVWNNGDGSDVNNGGLGFDTVRSNGNDAAAETYTYEPGAQAGRVLFKRVNPGPFQIDLEAERLEINTLGGDDTLSPVGGSLAGRTLIAVNAGAGNDTVVGGAGEDFLNGDAGNDKLTGGPGSDTANGGEGDDLMVWNNGDGTDSNTGDAGNDTVRSNGNDNAETYTYAAGIQANNVLFRRTGAGAFLIDLEAERLEINSEAGNDTFNPVGVGLAGRTEITVNGGDGDDVVNGGDGTDVQNGDAGDDTLVGGKGNDTANGGDGDDTMTWNPGDGNDRNDGGAGIDTVLSNGAAVAETYTYERVTEGDPAVDRVLFQRTAGAPAFSINFTAEKLEVNLLAGDDTISPVGVGLAGLSLIANGDAGIDTLRGAEGADTLNGGDDVDELRGGGGNDMLTAGKGNELIVAGDAGDDTMVWNPGDGNDINDGGEGIDTVLSNGAAAAETYTYEAKPQGRVLFQRTDGAPAFNIDFTAERLEVNLLDGDDTISPVGVGLAGLSLIANAGSGIDQVNGAEGADTLNGDAGNDTLIGAKGGDTVAGGPDNDTMIWNPGDGSDVNDGDAGLDTVLSNGVDVDETYEYGPAEDGRNLFQRTSAPAFSIDFTAEKLVVEGKGGNDRFAPANPAAAGLNAVSITINAGEGNDAVAGADGEDTLNGDGGNDGIAGGKGVDTANGGDGDDVMTWNNGDGSDVNNGGAGNDTVVSNGNDAAGESFTYGPGAADGRVQFDRLPNAQGNGAFGIDLEAEALVVNGRGGDDKFDPTGPGLVGRTAITVNAGEGNDVVNGGDGADALNGDGGDDLLTGGKGQDSHSGGAGDDLIVWNNGDASDFAVGGDGFDRFESNGAPAGDVNTLGRNAAGTTVFARTNLVPFTVTFDGIGGNGGNGGIDSVVVNGDAGDDALTVSAGLTALTVTADGGAGNDKLAGSEEADSFFGGQGNDVLTGGAGGDVLNGQAGDDQFLARDGAADLIQGEGGVDSAQTDALSLDQVGGVENVDALQVPAPPTPPAVDGKAALPELGAAKVVGGKRLFAQLPLACPATEAGGCAVSVTLQTAKAVKLGGFRGVVVLGSANVTLAPGARATAKIALNPSAAALAKGGKLAAKALISSTDAAGNTANTTAAVALKLPRAKK